jgi:hypothetical protein
LIHRISQLYAAEVDPDPYKIAYLRGGMNEVNRLATFALFSIGALELGRNRDAIRA